MVLRIVWRPAATTNPSPLTLCWCLSAGTALSATVVYLWSLIKDTSPHTRRFQSIVRNVSQYYPTTPFSRSFFSKLSYLIARRPVKNWFALILTRMLCSFTKGLRMISRLAVRFLNATLGLVRTSSKEAYTRTAALASCT